MAAPLSLDAYYSAEADEEYGHAACTIAGMAGPQKATELVASGKEPATRRDDLELVGREARFVASHAAAAPCDCGAGSPATAGLEDVYYSEKADVERGHSVYRIAGAEGLFRATYVVRHGSRPGVAWDDLAYVGRSAGWVADHTLSSFERWTVLADLKRGIRRSRPTCTCR